MRYSDDEKITASYFEVLTEASTFQQFFKRFEPIKHIHQKLHFKHDTPIELKQAGGNKIKLIDDLKNGIPIFWANSNGERFLAQRRSAGKGKYFTVAKYNENEVLSTTENEIANPYQILRLMDRSARIYSLPKEAKRDVTPVELFVDNSHLSFTYNGKQIIMYKSNKNFDYVLNLCRKVKDNKVGGEERERVIDEIIRLTRGKKEIRFDKFKEDFKLRYNDIFKRVYAREVDKVKQALIDKLDDENLSDKEFTELAADYRMYKRFAQDVDIENSVIKQFITRYKELNPNSSLDYRHSYGAPGGEIIDLPVEGPEDYDNLIRAFARWYFVRIPTKYGLDKQVNKIMDLI